MKACWYGQLSDYKQSKKNQECFALENKAMTFFKPKGWWWLVTVQPWPPKWSCKLWSLAEEQDGVTVKRGESRQQKKLGSLSDTVWVPFDNWQSSSIAFHSGWKAPLSPLENSGLQTWPGSLWKQETCYLVIASNPGQWKRSLQEVQNNRTGSGHSCMLAEFTSCGQCLPVMPTKGCSQAGHHSPNAMSALGW